MFFDLGILRCDVDTTGDSDVDAGCTSVFYLFLSLCGR